MTKAETLELGELLGPTNAARTAWAPVHKFRVPLDIATQTIGILGQKGSGKSNTEVRLAELFWDAGIPWVAVDPKGDWWGIRSSSTGEHAGLEVPILGGLHGDIALGVDEGAHWADVIVDSNLTAVLDVSDFSKGERARFLVAFFERLYRRHRLDPQVRHIFLEEAHEYIPQMVGREEGRLKEAAARIVLQGRTFGLGASACSQRSARLHKDVLTQIGTLVAHRTTGPQDRKAIEGWVKEHDLDGELVASLPSLKAGEAWFWSPEFLGVMDRVQVARRQTFDSGATPTVGMRSRQHATLADVDLAAIKEQMAESIERAKAEDPRELRKTIRALEAELAELKMWVPPPPPPPVEGLPAELVERLSRHRDATLEAARRYVEEMRDLSSVIDLAIEVDAEIVVDTVEAEPVPAPPPALRAVPAPAPPRPAKIKGTDELASGARKILDVAVASHPVRLTRSQLATFAGYSPKSSTWDGHIGNLRRGGYLLFEGKEVAVTELGLATSGASPSAPTSPAERLALWTSKLKEGPAKILRILVAAGAAGLTIDEVGARSGYSTTSSTFDGHLATLRRNGLTTTTAGRVRASEDLYG